MKGQYLKWAVLLLLFAFVCSPGMQTADAQQNQSRETKETAASGGLQKPQHTVGGELAKESNEAAGEESGNAKFTHSASVKALARWTGMSLEAARWAAFALNFAVLALLILLISKSTLPAMFRNRTGEIQRGITEAHKASEDANRRLADIEVRLSKLDQEVSAMRSEAERQSVAEEARIRATAEEDKQKIVEAARNEIAVAVKTASHELKAYTAELAISLAEKRIHVDAETDRALVGSFVEQFPSSNAPGKDGK